MQARQLTRTPHQKELFENEKHSPRPPPRRERRNDESTANPNQSETSNDVPPTSDPPTTNGEEAVPPDLDVLRLEHGGRPGARAFRNCLTLNDRISELHSLLRIERDQNVAAKRRIKEMNSSIESSKQDKVTIAILYQI